MFKSRQPVKPYQLPRKYEIKHAESVNIPNANGTFTGAFRIYAVRNFTTVDGVEIKIGMPGGVVQGYENLSHEGNSWIGPNAAVIGTGRIQGNMHYLGDAVIREGVMDDPIVYREASARLGPIERRAAGETYTVNNNGTWQAVEATGQEYPTTSRSFSGSSTVPGGYVPKPVADDKVPVIPFNRLPHTNTFSSLETPKIVG